jgi:hypothetical protein
MFCGTAQVSHKVCQFFLVLFKCLEMVPSSKLRKLWDCLSELRSYLCETRLESTVLRHALLLGKTAQFTLFFRQVLRHTVKSLSLTLWRRATHIWVVPHS